MTQTATETPELAPEPLLKLTDIERLVAERHHLLDQLDKVTTKLSVQSKLAGDPEDPLYIWLSADMRDDKLTWGEVSAIGLTRRPDMILVLAVHILSAAGRAGRAKAGSYSPDSFGVGCRNMDELAKDRHLSIGTFDLLGSGLADAMLFLNSMLYACRDQRHIDDPESRALGPVNAALDGLAEALMAYSQRDRMPSL